MLWSMHDMTELIALAFHGERVASRRLAKRDAISDAAALRNILTQAAGTAGLDVLLASRRALALAAGQRADQRAQRKGAARAARVARHDGPPNPWRAWFDGSAHPNPGRCGIGGLLLGPGGERIELSQYAGHGNSSEAEYQALVAVLTAAHGAGAQGLTVYGDSRVVLDDVLATQGAPALAAWRAASQAWIEQLGNVALCWVPRHKNDAADALSQRAVRASDTETPICPVDEPLHRPA